MKCEGKSESMNLSDFWVGILIFVDRNTTSLEGPPDKDEVTKNNTEPEKEYANRDPGGVEAKGTHSVQ